MAWIKEIEIAEADGLLARLYKQLLRPDGDVAHILRVHSILPQTLLAHLQFYRGIVMAKGELSRAQREMIAVAVSSANECHY